MVLSALGTPTTCERWCRDVSKASENALALGLQRVVELPYSWPWLVRVCLLVNMRYAGVAKLSMPTGFTLAQLRSLGPDMHAWIDKLGHGLASAKQLFTETGYDGPPELWSMYSCLFFSTGWERCGGPWVVQHQEQIIRTREALQAKLGFPPHPVRLLQAVLDSGVLES